MGLPNYQELMLPCLKIFADGKEKTLKDVAAGIIISMQISEEKQTLTAKSGVNLLHSRAHWAVYYMYRAGLLERAKRSYYKITVVGVESLKSGKKIDNEYLMQFDGFKNFITKDNKENNTQPQDIEIKDGDTPPERLEEAYNFIQSKLHYDLLDKLYNVDPYFFEVILLKLFESMGYGKATLTARSGDGGIDGIIDEDILGVNKIFLQAKRYAKTNKVDRPSIQMFVGALAGKKVTKGVFITTSDFTDNARVEAGRSNIILINGEELVELMVKYNMGVRSEKTYIIKKLDDGFFDENSYS